VLRALRVAVEHVDGTDPIPQTLPAGARPSILSHPVNYNFPAVESGCQ
jgi:hypothetical protein